MKTLIAMLMALLLGVSSAGADINSAPGNALGLRALARMCDGQRNCFISPVSLAEALAMAAQGAGGDTQAELLSGLKVARVEELTAMIPDI